MKPALIVTHMDDRASGLASECLAAAGCPIVEWNPADGPSATPPAPSELAGIVSLGGNQSATAVPGDPFLEAEVQLLRGALAEEVPILGLCLGAQLLAVAAGGRVQAMGRIYVGWPELEMGHRAAGDPVFGTLASGLRVLKWHEDMIDRVPGATVLGGTGSATPGIGLFRVGSVAWGSQPHLEATRAMLLDLWLGGDGGAAQVRDAGHDVDQFRTTSAGLVDLQVAAARPVFDRFAGVVTGVGQRTRATASTLLPSGSMANAA
jgi:GMP synthase-like glutamine amidotransferase